MISSKARTILRYYFVWAPLVCLCSNVCLGDTLEPLDTLELVQNLDNQSLQLFKDRRKSDESRYFLPKGRYYVTESLRLTSNTILMGEGPLTELEAHPNFNGGQFITNADLNAGNTNIRIEGLRIKFGIAKLPGNLPGLLRFEHVEQIILSDLIIEADTQYFCIDLSRNIIDATILDCNIQNRGNGGCIQVRNRGKMKSEACRQIRIQENTLSSVEDEPIAVFGWLGYVTEVNIANNIISADGASFGITAYGVDKIGDTGALEKVWIYDNNITGSQHGAIAVKGGVRNVVVDNNRVDRSINDGIFIDNGGSELPSVVEVTVRGNQITSAGRHGIYARGVNINVEGNQILQSREAGVFVSGRDGGRVDIVKNVIEKAGTSIILSGPTMGTITGNQMDTPDDILRLD
jgi:hypothetical protein